MLQILTENIERRVVLGGYNRNQKPLFFWSLDHKCGKCDLFDSPSGKCVLFDSPSSEGERRRCTGALVAVLECGSILVILVGAC